MAESRTSPGPIIGRMLPSGDGTGNDDTGQNEKKEAALSSILSKGQITALAALSIGDIDLLRQHLDRDHQTRFYSLILGLIVASLSLQILGGLIAIAVTHMRSYYQKHRADRSISDFCTICCGCRPRPGGALPSVERCCCNCFTCRTHPAYEYNVIAEYETWCGNAVRVEREACEAAEGLETATIALQACQERMDSYQKQFDEKILDTEDFIVKKKEVTQHMNSALEKKHYYLQLEANAAKFLKDGKVLYSRVDDIHRNRTMERATFFTHATNYLLFAVAILHALVLGLGVFTLKEVEDRGAGTSGGLQQEAVTQGIEKAMNLDETVITLAPW